MNTKTVLNFHSNLIVRSRRESSEIFIETDPGDRSNRTHVARNGEQLFPGLGVGVGPDGDGVVVAAADDQVVQGRDAGDPILVVDVLLWLGRALLLDVQDVDDDLARDVVAGRQEGVERRPQQVVGDDEVEGRHVGVVITAEETLDEVVESLRVCRHRDGDGVVRNGELGVDGLQTDLDLLVLGRRRGLRGAGSAVGHVVGLFFIELNRK